MDQKIICFGEMLWDVLPSGEMPGGAPMNVAIHLHYQGFRPWLVSRVGSDELGLELLNFLKQKDVATDWVQVDEVHPTGTVLANIQDKQEVIYEIVQPVAWDFIQTEEALEQFVSSADVMIYGSLAGRGEIARATLLSLLPKARLKVFDVNLRPPHYSRQLLEPLLQHADVLKMNHHELAEVAGWYGGPAEEETAMRRLKDLFATKLVIVTKGEQGAAVLSGEGYRSQPGFPVQVADTIGSGDAFLATFLNSFLSGGSLAEALHHACAMGALVATHKGATPVVDWKEVEVMIRTNS